MRVTIKQLPDLLASRKYSKTRIDSKFELSIYTVKDCVKVL